MFERLKKIFAYHQRCSYCNIIGHRPEMIKMEFIESRFNDDSPWSLGVHWFHPDCHKKSFPSKYKKCPTCGKPRESRSWED